MFYNAFDKFTRERGAIKMNGLLNKNEEEKILPLLSHIIETKQQICEIVKRDCKKCPLNIEDVCSKLELREFDFENHRWIDN